MSFMPAVNAGAPLPLCLAQMRPLYALPIILFFMLLVGGV